MILTYSRYNKKKHIFNLKGFGKNNYEILMTIYAMANKVKLNNDKFKSIEDVFKCCLELEKKVDRIEEI